MRNGLSSLCASLWMLGALAACTGPDETRQLGEQLDDVLDPTPDYVDKPADGPLDPR